MTVTYNFGTYMEIYILYTFQGGPQPNILERAGAGKYPFSYSVIDMTFSVFLIRYLQNFPFLKPSLGVNAEYPTTRKHSPKMLATQLCGYTVTVHEIKQ